MKGFCTIGLRIALWALLLPPAQALPGAADGSGPPGEPPAAEAAAGAPLAALAESIGLDLPAAYRCFGAPREVFAVRGPEAWQDDVVFYFDNHLYLFWLRDRVWQARVDRFFGGEFLGLRMGMSRAEVRARMGEPLSEGEGFLLFHLEDVGYPIRLRLLFEEERLVDAYCYRSDL